MHPETHTETRRRRVALATAALSPALLLVALALGALGCATGPDGTMRPTTPPPERLSPPEEYPPEPEVLILGRGAFQRGARYLRARRWAEALEAFRVSQHHVDCAAVSYNIARALYELRRYDEALRELVNFSQRYNVGGGDPLAPMAREVRDSAWKYVVDLNLSGSPRGAVVSIDGIDVGSVGLSREFTTLLGRHVIEVRAVGYQTLRWVVRLTQGTTYVREFHLERAPLPALPTDEATVRTPRRGRVRRSTAATSRSTTR